jgi:flavin-dependent dehydrogenase
VRSVSVIGAGPVGLVAALRHSQDCDVQLIASRPEPGEVGRVDALPAGLLALLVELGVHPHELGVNQWHSSFMAGWETDSPVISPSARKFHVDRRHLERQLWRLVRSRSRIQVTGMEQLRDRGLIIDATGRRAVTAARRIEPQQPWIARTVCFHGRFTEVHQLLRIAAVPDGYCYRIGTGDMLTIGFVGPRLQRAALTASPFAALGEREFDWMFAGVPYAASPFRGRGGKASVQWSIGEKSTVRIGDANLACDALSSHGIAGGVAQAMRVASDPNESSRDLVRRTAHLQNLQSMIRECRWRSESAWSDYSTFLSSSIGALASDESEQARSSKGEGANGAELTLQ